MMINLSQFFHSLIPSTFIALLNPALALSFFLFRQLETDPTLLLPKARAALDRYGHQLVIGNDLHRRKFEVVFVEPAPTTSPSSEGAGGGYRESWIRFGEEDVNPAGRRDGKGAREIEKEIVEALVERHEKWIGEGVDGGSAV
jgi:phosphopantothenate-cysteine ligase